MGLRALVAVPQRGGDDAKETWHCRLALEGSLVVKDGVRISVSALVDTGSEVNLVRKGLVDHKCLRPCGPEVSFVAVNKQGLGGNHNRLSCELSFQGCERDTKEKTTVVSHSVVSTRQLTWTPSCRTSGSRDRVSLCGPANTE